MFQLHRRLVHHQARTNLHDRLHRDEVVGLERPPRRNQIDDDIGQPYQRRQFHRTVQFDEVDVHALAGKEQPCGLDILGRHRQARAPAHRGGIIETDRRGHHHAALGNVQINRLVEAIAAVLDQHIFTGHAEIGRAVLHIGGHIRGANDEESHIRPIRANDELA